ncbi:hypothetical protein PGT21_010687 [Puccinia graminis f. sp. tritici]|uniref:Sister chromatid cohesion protein DCC1 n=2 Tax=Puccinia graminis f. sp. tritici TaxID=56615 RepID=E3K1V2_PUCGT|nr:uncharacterized protein PGTG_04233 [Puccinia graminis f. sp. tritici CRL 75-36-700-3]EFP78277.1 hypothetical protein PGTG_04233 [Puccinia graminis f. sp. tritici CRL 75-36-700-3]KAA1112789.1 hypothetical protein PGT21_010687 [Puccinia graminis f. sp. tritici]
MTLTSSSQEPHIIRFASPNHHQEIFNSNIHPTDDDELVNTSYLLLDLPPELLEPVKKQLQGHDTGNADLQMELRGRNDDEVVLTTPDKTFQLRTVQNSNSVMICGTGSLDDENQKLGLTVLKVIHETIELSDVTSFPGSRLDRIKELLQPHLYSGETNEAVRRAEDSDSTDAPIPVSLSFLSQQIRASDSEIQDYLRQLHVIELGGSLRMISLGYLSTILSGILKSLDELGVGPHEQFAVGPVVDIITSRLDIHQAALLQILHKFSIDFKIHEPYDSFDPNQNASLKLQEVVNSIGLAQLLCIKPTKIESNHNPKDHRYIQKMNVESFLATWTSKLPEGLSEHCSIESLSSHSILSNDQKNIIVIPIDKLSLEPKMRMSQLFEIQPKWKIDQIERFLTPITGGGMKKKFDELVLKFCRKIKEPSASQSKQNSKNSNAPETVWLTARNKW